MIKLTEKQKHELSLRIKHRRKLLKMSQEQVANAVKSEYPNTRISKHTISRLESEINQKVYEDIINKLGHILKCGKAYLLGETNTPIDRYNPENPLVEMDAIEKLLIENQIFRRDLAYIAKSMNKEFYQPIFDFIHQAIIGHRLIVHNKILEKCSTHPKPISNRQLSDISESITYAEILNRRCIEEEVLACIASPDNEPDNNNFDNLVDSILNNTNNLNQK